MKTCLATAATIVLFTIAASIGSSAKAEMCGGMWQPVCGIGKDGVKRTWANTCWAKTMDAKHLRQGMCGK
jgi:hypothetical protein